MKRILIILASNNHNLQLAQKIDSQLKSLGASSELLDLTTLDLPLFTSRKMEELKTSAFAEIKPLVEKLKNAEAFFIVSPEYNGGIPPILTNFIAWVSLSTNYWREAFYGKSAAIATYSGGSGLNLIMALRNQLSYIGLNLIGHPLQVNEKTPIDEKVLDSITRQISR